MHSSCGMEHFVETHLCKLYTQLFKLCVIIRSRVLQAVLIRDTGRRLSLEVRCSLYQRVNRVMLVSLLCIQHSPSRCA